MVVFNEANLYKEFYSISKIKMGSKNIKKWKNYVTDIKQEYYDKLNQYFAIENNGDNKNSKAFRLKKMVRILIFSKRLMKMLKKITNLIYNLI